MLIKDSYTTRIPLPNKPCVHGLSNANWCALCKSANGDKHAAKIIKLFTPKTNKKYHQDINQYKPQT